MATAAFAKSREALYRAVFELARDATFVLDRTGYLDCNQAGLDIFGLANQQELRSVKFGDMSPPLQPDGRESAPVSREYVEAAYRDGAQTFEWLHKRRDGTTFFAEIWLSRIEIAGKQYLHAILHDISERKRTEEETRRSREQLARVVEGSSDGYWDLHVPSGKLTLSERWATMLGYRLEEITQTREFFFTLIHPNDLEHLNSLRKAYLAGKAPIYEIEFRLRNSKGEWQWLLSRGKVVSWVAPGQPEWFCGTHVDIHARKRAEELLAMQYAVTEIITAADEFESAMEKILQALAQALDFCVGTLWLPTPDGTHLYCAHIWRDPKVPMDEFLTATRKIQFSRGEGLPGTVWEKGTSIWKPVGDSSPNFPRAPLAIKAGFRTGLGFPLRVGDAIVGALDFFCREVRHPDDSLRSALAKIGEQIAQFQQRKQTERRLVEANVELENRVAARTLELRNHHDGLELVVQQRTRELQENNIRLVAEIVERKRTEEELRKLSWAVENSPTMVMITDALGRIEYVNPRFVQITGYAEKEVLGRSTKMLKSNTHSREFYESLWQTLATGQTWHGDFLNKRKNGQLYWQTTTISPIRNAAGIITHFVSVMEDVTERKRVDEEMRRARDAAETASRAKSEFLANVSHEIRTPMNAIIGMNHLLKLTKLTGRQRNFVVNIESAAQNLMDVINDILDFSKIESGNVELEYVEFTLDSVMSKLAHMTTLEAQKKALDFTISVAPDIPSVLVGDPMRLGQVLLNLTSNAIKFTPQGRVSVSAALAGVKDKSIELRFTVSDTGIGIDDKLRAKLFKPFEQADASTTRRYGGTGLGLVIAKRFIELMNGTVDVQTKVGAGTTIAFTVRVADAGKQAWQVHPQLPEMVGRRALLADENENSRTALQHLLSGFAFDVVCAASESELMDEVRRASAAGIQGYDLVFISEGLSPAAWTDTVAQIRAQNSATKQPAIVLVATRDSEAMRASIEGARLEGFLLKPFTRSSLYDVMLHALTSTPPADPAQSMELAAPEARQVLNGARILLVEDNEINQQVAVEILRLTGSDVTVAGGGTECLRILSAPNAYLLFDLILMDLQMPEMDGFDVTRRIRLNPLLIKIPILAMTADVVQGVRERCLAAGMNDYLSKPIKPAELYSKAASWIQDARKSPEERAHSKRPTVLAPRPPAPAKAIPKSGKYTALTRKNPYVDAEAGIARVAGNCVLYERLLKQFHDKYNHACDGIEDALKRGQREEAVRLAHTVKGVSGNLGVNALHKAAMEWERCLKENQENDSAARERFRSTLNASMTAIAKMLPAPEFKSQPTPPFGMPKVPMGIPKGTRESLARLGAMLESNDMDALSLSKTLCEQLDGHSMDPLLAAMRESINRFDFVSALSILSKIQESLELSNEGG